MSKRDEVEQLLTAEDDIHETEERLCRINSCGAYHPHHDSSCALPAIVAIVDGLERQVLQQMQHAESMRRAGHAEMARADAGEAACALLVEALKRVYRSVDAGLSARIAAQALADHRASAPTSVVRDSQTTVQSRSVQRRLAHQRPKPEEPTP